MEFFEKIVPSCSSAFPEVPPSIRSVPSGRYPPRQLPARAQRRPCLLVAFSPGSAGTPLTVVTLGSPPASAAGYDAQKSLLHGVTNISSLQGLQATSRMSWSRRINGRHLLHYRVRHTADRRADPPHCISRKDDNSAAAGTQQPLDMLLNSIEYCITNY